MAADLATGKRAWTYGTGLKGPIAYGGGKVFVVVESGRVAALSSRTGEPRWFSTTIASASGAGRINRLLFSGGLLLTNSYNNGGTVLDPARGGLRWRIEEHESEGYLGTVDDVLLWGVDQGSPHWHHIFDYDLNAGRQLWRVRMAGGRIAIESEHVYLWDQWTAASIDNPNNVAIRVVDGRTGTELKRWMYQDDFRCSRSVERDTKAFALDTQFFYLGEQCGERVARFPRGGAQTPLARYATPDHGRWIAGPYHGMLFFATANNHLLGVRLEGGRPVSLSGVDMPTGPPLSDDAIDNSISRLDLIGDQVYVGQTDGLFRALNIDSGELQFNMRTVGGGFGPTLRVGGYLVIEVQGEVMVVRLRP